MRINSLAPAKRLIVKSFTFVFVWLQSQKNKRTTEDSGISSDVSPAGTFTSQDSAKYKELKQQTKFGKFFSPFGKVSAAGC